MNDRAIENDPFAFVSGTKEKEDPFASIVGSKEQDDPFAFISQPKEEGNVFSEILSPIRENIIKPAKKVGNITLDTLSYLDRPRNALALGVRDLATADTESTITRKEVDKSQVFLRGAKRGLFGEDTFTTRDLLPKEVQKEYPVASGALGFAGDVLTDPLTYVGAGIGGATTRGIKGGLGVIEKAAPTLFDNQLLRAFNVYRGDLGKIRELEGKYRDLYGAGKYEVIRNSKEWNKRLDDLSTELGISREELNASIVRQTESPVSTVPKKISEEANLLREKNRTQHALESELGIKIGDVENYFPHIPTREGMRALAKERVFDIFRKSEVQHASTKARRIEGTVEDINARKILGTEKFFTDDPIVAQAVRDLRHANSVSAALFLDDVGKQFGKSAADAPAHFVETSVPLLKGMKFDPEVAQYIKKNWSHIGSPKEVAGFLDLFDQAQGWWKRWSLGARPAYHTRNAVGNLWNNYIGGVKNPVNYLQATKMEVMEQSGKFTGNIAGKPAFELYDAALTHGVLGRMQYHGDIAENVIHEVNKTLTKYAPSDLFTPTTRNLFLRAGFTAGRKIEENARLAHFIDRVRKGDSYDQAAKSVKKYLFDYEDLSPVEQKVFKRLIPFYTWTRKNIPLQVEAIVENPQRFNRINLIRNQVQGEIPDEEAVSEQMKELGPIYVGETPEGDKKAFTLSGYLPFMDVQKMLNPKEEFTGMISPFLKEPLEQIFNYDTFRNEAIKKYKGQTSDFLGVKMPVRLVHLARNIVMLNEFDRANPFNIFGQNQVDPITGERVTGRSYGMEKEFSVGQFGVGTSRESRIDMAGMDRLLQYATGLKPVAVDEEFGKAMYSMKMKKDIDELRMYMRRAKRRGKEREAEEVEKAMNELFGDIRERINK